MFKKVYEAYGTNRTEFAKLSGISYHTLEGWETKGISALGEITMHLFLEKKELERKAEMLEEILLMAKRDELARKIKEAEVEN